MDGEIASFLPTAMYRSISFSPNGDYLLVSEVKKPFSYLVPYYRFPYNETVYDTNGEVITVINKVPLDELVGNGSRVKVQYNEWETTNKYGTFKGLDFQAMQVLNLISYKAGDGDEFDAVEGGEEF